MCDPFTNMAMFYMTTEQHQYMPETPRRNTADCCSYCFGAKRYTSHVLLYYEVGWDRLEIRRQLHKLALFHQIVHKQAPEYLIGGGGGRLIELIPPTHKHPPDTTDTNKQRPCKTYPLKTFGKRHTQIIISQIRMNFSDLNEHLFNKNCIDSSMCRCGKGPESAVHYFLSCEIYELHRENMFNSISSIYDLSQITLNLLLFGDIDCNFEINQHILNATHRYM